MGASFLVKYAIRISLQLVFLPVLLCTTTAYSQTFAWASWIGNPTSTLCNSYNSGRATTVDNAGNVYFSGMFTCAPADFNPGAGVYPLSSIGIRTMYIQKLTAGNGLLWARVVGGTGSNVYPTAMTNDDTNNIYILGTFDGYVDFDPGPTDNFLYESDGGTFVLKLTSSGSFVWVKQFGTVAHDIKADGAGNLYICGSFAGVEDFDPGAGMHTVLANGIDGYILKLDGAGEFVRVLRIGGNTDDEAQAITLDGIGNLYYSGTFTTTADLNPGLDTASFSTTGYDIFVSKLDTSGNYLWAKQFSGSNHGLTRPTAIATDASMHVCVTGMLQDIVDFDPSPTSTFFLSADPVNNDGAFTVRLDSSGGFSWARSTAGAFWGRGLGIDSACNVYTGGDLDLIGMFIQRLDSSGNLLWISKINDPAGGYLCHDIAVDRAGNTYITGEFSDSLMFEAGPGDNKIGTGIPTHIFPFSAKIGPATPIVTNADAINQTTAFEIYPNPTAKTATLKSRPIITAVIITDIIGTIVYRFAPHQREYVIQVETPGIYFVNVISEEGRHVKRLVVSN